MTSNFDFLNNDYPELAKMGREAESILYLSPGATLIQIGTLCERLVNWVFDESQLERPKGYGADTHDSRLKTLRSKGILPDEQYYNLDNIRLWRNKATHAAYNPKALAEAAIELAHQTCEWLIRAYKNPDYPSHAFVMPPHQNDSPTAGASSAPGANILADSLQPINRAAALDRQLPTPNAALDNGQMTFNRALYVIESADPLYQQGMLAAYSGDTDQGISILDQCNKQGNILAGIVLGELYSNTFHKGSPRYHQRVAIPYYQKGMNHGYPLGAILLADAYETGKGVHKARNTARDLWNQYKDSLAEMSDTGDVLAQYYYADALRRYENDVPRAAMIYERVLPCTTHPIYAIKAGYQLARIYLYGPNRDVDRGMEVLAETVELYPQIQSVPVYYELGRSYFEGISGIPDYARARQYLSVAADKGDAHSLYYMGELYYYGLEVDADQDRAIVYYQQAANQRYTPAMGRLRDIGLQ